MKFTFKKEAKWSDGKPVVAEDFWATWQVFINPKNNPISRTGYEDIKSVTRGNSKTVTVVFKKVYADWEALVSSGVYPAHVVKGKDMNEMFLNSVPVSSGPWKFSSWQKGVQITVVKNPAFKAGPAMKLDRLVFRYILDTNSRFQALKAGEGQVMEPQPQLQIADFMKDSKFKVDTKVGYTYEHIDFQFGAKGHPALKQPFVRQALIQGMNRAQVAGALYGEISKGLPALQSLIYKPFELAVQEELCCVAVQPGQGDQLAQGAWLHRWPGQAERGQRQDLLVPERRQALVPVLHDDGQPASRPDVRDHPAAAQVRRHRAGAAVPDGWRHVRHDAAVAGLGPDAVRMGRLAVLVDHGEGHSRLRWRPERRRLLQPGTERRS